MTFPGRAIRTCAVALATCVLFAACGLRTPVRPPEDTAPVIPGTPTVTHESNATVVRWKRAERSTDGERLTDLAAFAVERKKGDGAWERVGTVSVVDQEKIRRRNSFTWRDSDVPAGATYRVIAVTADGEEGPPNEAVEAPAVDTAAAPATDTAAAPAASEAAPAPEGNENKPASDPVPAIGR